MDRRRVGIFTGSFFLHYSVARISVTTLCIDEISFLIHRSCPNLSNEPAYVAIHRGVVPRRIDLHRHGHGTVPPPLLLPISRSFPIHSARSWCLQNPLDLLSPHLCYARHENDISAVNIPLFVLHHFRSSHQCSACISVSAQWILAKALSFSRPCLYLSNAGLYAWIGARTRPLDQLHYVTIPSGSPLFTLPQVCKYLPIYFIVFRVLWCVR